MLKVEPHKIVLPLIGYKQPKESTPVFLGTGFFVENAPNSSLLVTVNHVVEDWNGNVGILVYPDSIICAAELIAQYPEVDLALLDVPEYCPDKPLKVAQDDELLINQLVNCYEYSGSWFFKEAGAHTATLSSSCRLGNITRFVDLTDQYDQAGQEMLVLSFAALRGASGAPVVSNSDLHLWGIVTANRAYHLLPAQIETVLDEKNQLIEEIKFMLPQALAIHVKHLRSILEQVTY